MWLLEIQTDVIVFDYITSSYLENVTMTSIIYTTLNHIIVTHMENI